MDNIRLKTKIGEHELELEGPPEYVREQVQAWQELVKMKIAAEPSLQNPPPTGSHAVTPLPKPQDADPLTVDSDLTKITKSDGRYISLTGRPTNVQEAVLVMLYAQKILRNNEAVTGTELLSGLATSGGYGIVRLDRILDKLAELGEVMSFGERRGKRYRLTNTGVAKAKAIAAELIEKVS